MIEMRQSGVSSLQAQALKQQENHAQLKAYIDDEIHAVHERISAQIRDSQLGLKACVDSLGRNIQDLKDAMRCLHHQSAVTHTLCSFVSMNSASDISLCSVGQYAT